MEEYAEQRDINAARLIFLHGKKKSIHVKLNI